jgi:holo-[acyl-carrier-protein] synthase
MIIGIGTDIVKIERIRQSIDKYGDSFLNRCFTETERARSQTKHDPVCAFARLFAAKEALLKAMGTGMIQGLSWHDLQISWDERGAPKVTLGKGVKTYLQEPEMLNIHLSMSDDADYAIAYAIIEKN